MRFLPLLLLLLISTAAAVPVPPLADDPSLVLRFSFDKKPTLQQKYSWEGSWEGWSTVNPSGNCGSGPYITGVWSTDGQYSAALDATGQSGATTCYEPYTYMYISADDYIHQIQVDINVTISGTSGKFSIYVNAQEVWNTTTSYSGTVTVALDKTVNEIKFYVSVADGSADRVTAYIDNLRITFKVQDDSGNGNDGTIYGAQWVTGRYGYGLQFNPDTRDSVVVSYSPELNISATGEFTLTAIINFQSKPTASPYYNYIVVYEGGTAVCAVIDNYQPNAIYCYVYLESGATRTALFSSTQDGHTYFIAFTGKLNESVKLYVVDYTTGEYYYKEGGVIDQTLRAWVSTQVIYIGGVQGVDRTVDGWIDEVRIYNRALSESEIRQMYEALRVKFYDESTGEKIAANATIFNVNYSISLQTDEVTKEAVLFNSQLPETGDYFIRAEASGYYDRTFYTTLGDSLVEKDVLLLSQNEQAVLVSFILNDIANLYEEALLRITKFVGGAKYDITIDKFDIENKASAILRFNDKYFISIIDSQTSTERTIGEFTAVESTEKVINVMPNLEPSTPLNVSYDIDYCDDYIIVTYNDVEQKTQSLQVLIYNETGALVYSDSTTANDYALSLSKPDNSTWYTVVLNITRDNITFTQSKVVGSIGGGILKDVTYLLPGEDVLGYKPEFVMAAASFIMLTIFGALFSRRHNRIGALAVAIGAGMLTLFGWLPIEGTVIIVVLFLAVLGKLEEGYKKG